MHIIDINGKTIEVTDLEAALIQATLLTTYFHEDKVFSDFDETQKAYWQDIVNNLEAIKENTEKRQ